jgi:hypothetical protein
MYQRSPTATSDDGAGDQNPSPVVQLTMPSYRSLSAKITGAAADSTREAESLRRNGDLQSAVVLLEEALESSLVSSARIPGWLCGRLAALYRTLGRYDDEVHVLERYRDSQVTDEARTRYEARLYKARSIAARKRRPDNGALTSVRTAMNGSRSRRHQAPAIAPAELESLPEQHVALLASVLAVRDSAAFDEQLEQVLILWAVEARAREIGMDELVNALRACSQRAGSGGMTEELRAERYTAALMRLIAIYFDDVDEVDPG